MVYFVVNPASRSGRGQKYWDRIKPVLEKKQLSYEVYFSGKPGDTIELVKKLCSHAPTGEEKLHLIILGGDGTVNEALQGIDDFSRVSLSYIPTGSSNDLARDLGISTVPEEALENSLARKNIRLMDVGLLHYEQAEVTAGTSQPIDRRFMVGCGMGFDAAVCEEALNSPIKDTLNHLGLGKLTYLGIALKQLIQSRLSTGRLTLDGEKTIEFDRLLFMVGMVHRYEGGGFMFCPHARDDDGLLDFCVVHDITKGRVLRLLPTAFRGEHLRFDEVEEYRAREALLESDIPLWVQTDGEVKTKATRIRLSILEEKIEFNY